MNETGYWAIVASKINSNQELANLNKVINLANKFSQESFKTLYDYVEFLDESIEAMDDESQAQVASEENSVRIMTIHQSKGLEFKAVFLYETNSRGQDDKVNSGNIAIDKKFGILTHLPVEENYFGKYSTPPIVSIYNFIQMKKNLAELKRLFYVGITRAEEFLFISASAKEFKAGKGTFFSLLKEGLQFNGDEEVVDISTKLETLDRDTMESSKREVNLRIPLIKTVDEIENPFIMKTENYLPKKFAIEKIEDKPEREIISATKIAVFNQCPVKYELTYELGYSKFINLLKKQEKENDFNHREDEELNEAADLKGSIIHSILQNEIDDKNLDEAIENLLENQYFERRRQLVNPESFSAGIKKDLIKLYSSAFFKKIAGQKNYKNEFELYTGEGKYFLYGIIDKLIIENKKIIILDYKTDKIEKNEILNESVKYTHQLNFYAFIVKKLFPEKKVETILLFVKHPDEPVIKTYSDEMIKAFGKKLGRDIVNIHQQNFVPNPEHCRYCQFFEKGKCLKIA